MRPGGQGKVQLGLTEETARWFEGPGGHCPVSRIWLKSGFGYCQGGLSPGKLELEVLGLCVYLCGVAEPWGACIGHRCPKGLHRNQGDRTYLELPVGAGGGAGECQVSGGPGLECWGAVWEESAFISVWEGLC